MLRNICLILALFLIVMAPKAQAASAYDVSDVQVKAEAKDAVQARDQAITMAQRQAFAALVGRQPDKLGVSDQDIARLVTNFSVQGERVTSKSYSARFNVRFHPGRTQAYIAGRGMSLTDPSTRGSSETSTATQQTVQTDAATPGQLDTAAQIAPAQDAVLLVLPVLDIGTRRILWDEPNPWRDLWQKSDQRAGSTVVRAPLGDISDMNDVPDAGLIGGKAAPGVRGMLSRYGAQAAYIPVIRNQGSDNAMVLSLYRGDGNEIKMVRKEVIKTRAGHAFDDAIPHTLRLIAESERNPSAVVDENVQAVQPEPPPLAVTGNGSVTMTVPYQSLTQWVNIQRRLRSVQGVRAVIPTRVSPSSAQVKIMSGGSASDLASALRAAGFQVQALPNGENALTE